MREYVLNHVSVQPASQRAALDWFIEIAEAMSELYLAKVAGHSIRSDVVFNDISCSDGSPLDDPQTMLFANREFHAARWWQRIQSKYPIDFGLSEEIKDRMRLCEATGCEPIKMTPTDGSPLLLCAFMDGIVVSFPSDQIWKQDRLTVTYDEMRSDDQFDNFRDDIDNLCCNSNVIAIHQRHIEGVRNFSSFAELWRMKHEAFPSLLFGLGIEDDLKKVNTGLLRKVIRVLATLDDSSTRWKQADDGRLPDHWYDQVSSESETVQNDPSLREARRFKTHDGGSDHFFLHARITRGVRLHLRTDNLARQVEIGYIGPHLPTKKFS